MYVYEINVVHLKLTQCYISFMVNYILIKLGQIEKKTSNPLGKWARDMYKIHRKRTANGPSIYNDVQFKA